MATKINKNGGKNENDLGENIYNVYTKIGGLSLMVVIMLMFISSSVSAVSLPDAVDNTALAITTGGNANWFGETTVYYYGGDAAQSGVITHNQNTYMQTTITGPGTLTFYWKVSSETNYDFLRFYIDGVEQTGRISGSINWQQKSYTLTSGVRTLKWSYTKDGSVSSGSDAGWVDKVVFTASAPPTIPLPEAVDNTALSITTGGNANWFGETTTYYYGNDAAQSGAITHNQNTYMQTTVTGPKTLNFYDKVSSESMYDWIRFYIDGYQQYMTSGEGGFSQKTYTIPGGSHTLKWAYTKDGSVNSGSDAAWVDKVQLDSCTLLPVYDPGVWNNNNYTRQNNNCYNYGTDKITNTRAQPGYAGTLNGNYWDYTSHNPRQPATNINCPNYIAASQEDGLVFLSANDINLACPADCSHKVALAIKPNEDFHWYRPNDGSNTWSHKRGGTNATDRVNVVYPPATNYNSITDPDAAADAIEYTSFCGYFCVKKSSVTIG